MSSAKQKTINEMYRWYGTKEQAIKLADKLKNMWKDHSPEYTSAPIFEIAKNRKGYYVKKVQTLTMTGEEYAETITKFRAVQILAL